MGSGTIQGVTGRSPVSTPRFAALALAAARLKPAPAAAPRREHQGTKGETLKGTLGCIKGHYETI